MVRVMMLAPFLVMLSAWFARTEKESSSGAAAGSKTHLQLPWFALGFIAVVLFNSLHLLPAGLVQNLLDLDTFLLAAAMAALGAGTRLPALRQAGIRPLLLAALLFVWLVGGGMLVNDAVHAWL
jgi:uncharacterized integral membrane protein (TIGR00698 family)